ncbi:hypothetical protein MRB53_011454 [Persea americana]|uniref:Uncharacterized protein n=1 Tax=Persea americana TaxID=3435 RepID=A0ACC2LW93_PERAE|nr:hypothetical protein MRB53_011454 [Persea americana]
MGRRGTGKVEKEDNVGRISFLIENEKAEGAEPGNHSKHSSHSRKCVEKVEAATAVLLKRNCSSSVYEKRKAFWHVGWLFKKKKEMGSSALGRNSSASEEKGGFSGKNRSFPVPACVNRDEFSEIDRGCDGEMRTGFGVGKGTGLDCEKAAGFIDMMAGLSSEPKRGFSGLKSGGFAGQETEFLGEKDAGFIDLEVDFLSKSKGGLSGLKGASYVDSENELGNVKVGGLSSLGRFGSLRCGLLEHGSDLKVGGFSSLQGNGLGGLRCCSLDHEPGSLGQFRSADSLSNGSSCRITVNDCEIRGGKRSLKVWKWIFKNSKGRSGRK